MVLADTSVWIDHLRRGDRRLAKLLDQSDVVCHPLIIGELACGNMQNRETVLGLLRQLPTCPEIEQREAWHFIDLHRLAGRGIGIVDVHLLASARLFGATVWTRDRSLDDVALELGLALP